LFVHEGKFVDEPAEIINETQVDFNGDFCVPGFVDVQVYGAGGILFSDEPTVNTLKRMAQALMSGGCTTFLPTVATNSREVMYAAIEAVKAYQEKGLAGVAGIHLEGPYINAEKKGAHLENKILEPTQDELKGLIDYADGTIKIMTLAPEKMSAGNIHFLVENNIKVSVGHTTLSYEDAIILFDKYTLLATHLFNAMPPVHHRNPGLPVAIMMHENVQSSIVADGIHVHYDMIKLAKKMMGKRLFLITDAVAASKGVYPHQLDKDRFILPDGTLSGSALTMLQAVKNVIQYCEIETGEAFSMATLYPANAAGLNYCGRLQSGTNADFLRIGKDLELKAVYKTGKAFPLSQL
ncbi:MAG: N-acetylglucosamine-6-phosphate deacetylase, partial [Ferruginibacter sp.]